MPHIFIGKSYPSRGLICLPTGFLQGTSPGSHPQHTASAGHNMSLVVEPASRMETIDNYVCFVLLGADTTAVAVQVEDKSIAFCQEENERALYVLEQDILEQLRD